MYNNFQEQFDSYSQFSNNNINAYKILGITNKNYDLDELKSKYKKIAKKVHPDKPGGDKQLFNLIKLSYKKLYKKYKLKQIDKQFNELRNSSHNFIKKQNNEPKRSTHSDLSKFQLNNQTNINEEKRNLPTNFSDAFNKVFEENRIRNSYDRGYGKMMAKHSVNREDIDITRTVSNMKDFKNKFENQELNKYNKQLMIYKEPEALPSSNGKLNYAILGEGKIPDFSSESNNLLFTDYRKAHTTSRLIDPRLVKKREEYKDINALHADRSNISFQLTPEEAQRIALRKRKENEREIRRIERLKQQDMQWSDIHNRTNQLMIDFIEKT